MCHFISETLFRLRFCILGVADESNLARIEHAHCFLQRLFKAASNSHDFAHGTHLWTNMAVSVLEFLEIPARDFDGYVVQRWFEACGCDFSDFVDELGQCAVS